MHNKTVHKLSRRDRMRRRAAVNLLRLTGLLLQIALFAVMWQMGFAADSGLTRYQSLGLTATYAALFILLARIYDGVEVNSRGPGEITYSMGLAQLFTLLFQYMISCLTVGAVLNPLPFLLLLIGGSLVSAGMIRTGARLYRRLFPAAAAYLVYDYLEPDETLRNIQADLSWKFRIVGVLNLGDGMENVLERLDEVEAVILCGVHSTDRNTILKNCVIHDTQMYIKPKIGDLLLHNAVQLQLLSLPILRCGQQQTGLLYEGVKRAMDILLSGLALLVLSPLMAVVAVLIRRDGGPAIYRQTRLTRDGRAFEILKFRSMRVDAEKDGIARLATEDDDRVTPVGGFLRACRIDELPQLINILRGEMSIVGPRPERPEIAALYEEEMPEFALRLQVKAGLTGLAQVYGKYNTKPYDKLQMDLLYIARQSVWQDIKLIFLTVKVLFMRESTEGVARGQVTAETAQKEVPDSEYSGQAS